METDRPHRSNSSNNTNSISSSSTSELFICFSSRLSSSSMKISSKSILSPGRSREPSQISLSTSLSRRLRTNGSMKGGQASPMFPNNAKKRGCSYENPEPSSPKVTCIGQVRVKSKKQAKKMRTRSQRRSGEVSFRKVEQTNNSNNSNLEDLSHPHVDNQFLNHQQQQQECLPHRNQKWVHLPLTICETLRAFGAEFNCFLPCRSSCMASEKDKEEKAAAASSNGGSSCSAVFARWLVAVQEGDGKGREIELVVGEEEVEEEEESSERRSYRRHIFEEIDFKEEKYEGANEGVEEEARVSICVPPKNALLLMRCRSDPVKMAALANKFWEPPVPNVDDDEEEEETEDNGNDEEENNNNNVQVEAGDEEEQTEVEQQMDDLIKEKWVSCGTVDEHQVQETQIIMEEEDNQERNTDIGCEKAWNLVEQEEETEIEVNHQETKFSGPSSQKETEDPEHIKIEESEDCQQHMQTTQVDEQESKLGYELEDSSANVLSVQPEQESKSAAVQEFAIQESKEQKETTENYCTQGVGGEESATHEKSESLENPKTQEGQTGLKSKEKEGPPLLPDCLLLMMCEPKLSMEVSKETWVCSTDFVRWLPEHSRPVKKKDGRDEPKKRRSIDIHPPPVHSDMQQPPRSSCSYPAKPPARAAGAESISTAIEKKLVGSKGYEPFVLTRCKSEPMRSAAKIAPEACFWKNRKLEPHRPGTVGVGAAGVGC